MAYYYSQQYIEKLLKSFIDAEMRDDIPPHVFKHIMSTHDLKKLCLKCSGLFPDYTGVSMEVLTLSTSYYYESRYPSDLFYGDEDASLFVATEKEVNTVIVEIEKIESLIEQYYKNKRSNNTTSEFN